ncbi:MAG: pyruvate kinase [Candidatus Heimdallarchaeota archaeon]
MAVDDAKGAIIATLGPSSDNPDTLRKMIDAGLDLVRLNMSHGTHADAKKRFELVREVNDQIPVLFDLSGPKIRIGKMDKPVILQTGQEFTLCKDEIIGNETKASVTYSELIDLAEIGHNLFLNDGLIELEVVEKIKDEIRCKIVNGGPLSSRKGVNAPDVPIALYSPTAKDKRDLDFTISLEPDFYSVSFVRRVDDLTEVRQIISTYTDEKIPLISKIEHKNAITNIEDIIKSSDGIMVARGDLGVELPPEEVPLIQQSLVEKCNDVAKTCIVATQMLESMVFSPRSTRAETSDVANAILQGADAVMLSAETATGNYPVEAVRMMNRIIRTVEDRIKQRSSDKFDGKATIAGSIGRAAVSLASGLQADYLLAYTRSGVTSQLVSKFRPNQPIIVITPNIKTARRTRMQWGVTPIWLKRDFNSTDEMIHAGMQEAFRLELIEKHANCVIVAGSLLGLPSTINLIQYLNANDIISSLEASERFSKAYQIA